MKPCRDVGGIFEAVPQQYLESHEEGSSVVGKTVLFFRCIHV